MAIVYLDSDFRCHLENDGSMHPIETDFFDERCKIFIEGYRFIPEGQIWTRADGVKFRGLMIAPAVDHNYLLAAQAQYEADMVAATDMQTALNILGVIE